VRLAPRRRRVRLLPIIFVLALLAAALMTNTQFEKDMQQARAHAAQGSVLLPTRCGPIEHQEAGNGVPLLVVHGSGGGHDRGMALAGALALQGVRVIAVSRFGYLRTPMPDDASVAAQADAHVCLLDALGISRAAVLGASAGGPSALQMALRHPDRVSVLVLMVPLTYLPPTSMSQAQVAPSMPAWAETLMLKAVGSDFLSWTALHLSRNLLIKTMLATPPELVAAASPQERERVEAMLDGILPVTSRAVGLRSDTDLGKHLADAPLESIRAATVIVSARDDRYGTYDGAQYTASRIPSAKFIGFQTGGHTLVGHNDEVMRAVRGLVVSTGQP
jgi:2-hydroxy-6-oxonona-2,4-dienedioate hydrolase